MENFIYTQFASIYEKMERKVDQYKLTSKDFINFFGKWGIVIQRIPPNFWLTIFQNCTCLVCQNPSAHYHLSSAGWFALNLLMEFKRNSCGTDRESVFGFFFPTGLEQQNRKREQKKNGFARHGNWFLVICFTKNYTFLWTYK